MSFKDVETQRRVDVISQLFNLDGNLEAAQVAEMRTKLFPIAAEEEHFLMRL